MTDMIHSAFLAATKQSGASQPSLCAIPIAMSYYKFPEGDVKEDYSSAADSIGLRPGNRRLRVMTLWGRTVVAGALCLATSSPPSRNAGYSE